MPSSFRGARTIAPDATIPKASCSAMNTVTTIDDIVEDMRGNYLLSGITLTGGEPFLYPNELCELVDKVKEEFLGFNVWAWSGYKYEQLICDESKKKLLDKCDVLIDGPFIEDRKSYACQWRGSTNQRVIDLVKTREKGELVLHKDN